MINKGKRSPFPRPSLPQAGESVGIKWPSEMPPDKFQAKSKGTPFAGLKDERPRRRQI
jgi:hypothetical protein